MTQKRKGPFGHSMTGAGPDDGWMHPARTGAAAGDSKQVTTPRDQGCNLAPKCLECPFPTCKHDGGRTNAKIQVREGKDAQAENLVTTQGLTPEQAARRLGVTPRTVYRMISRVRARTNSP